MRRSSVEPVKKGVRVWVVFVALGFALAAMAALHVIQPELDPLAEPVSFYVWGAHGWLLPVALGAFGIALLALARGLNDERLSRPRRILAPIGGSLLLAALVPSDRWFPWEGPPSFSGVVHAAAAMLAPVLLVWPMVSLAPGRNTRARRVLFWSVGLFIAALLGSAASLAVGFLREGPPPWIGMMERVLAVAAMSWVCAFAWQARIK